MGAFHPLFLTADAVARLAFFYFWIGVGLCMNDLSVGLGWGWKSPFSSEDGGGNRLSGCGYLRMGFEVTLKPLFVCFYVFLLHWSPNDGELRARLPLSGHGCLV